MSLQLVVVRPFHTYAKGDVISDAASIAQITASEKASWVVRVNAAPQPPTQAQPQAKQGS